MSNSANSSFCDSSSSGVNTIKTSVSSGKSTEYDGPFDGIDPDGIEFEYVISGIAQINSFIRNTTSNDKPLYVPHKQDSVRFNFSMKNNPEYPVEDFLNEDDNFDENEDNGFSYEGEQEINNWIHRQNNCGNTNDIMSNVTIISIEIIKVRQENYRHNWLKSIKSKKLRVSMCSRCKTEHDQTDISKKKCQNKIREIQYMDRRSSIMEMNKQYNLTYGYVRNTSILGLTRDRVSNRDSQTLKDCKYKDTPWLCSYHVQGRCKFNH